MERDAKPKLQAIVLVVVLLGGTTLVLASGLLPAPSPWRNLGALVFLLTIPLILLVGLIRFRQRRISATFASGILVSTLLLGILAQVATGVSP
ncbi:MAG: hypothetical protein ACE5EW_06875, partial [Thermoplasmata archaeon]